jgi:hypothetical protein
MADDREVMPTCDTYMGHFLTRQEVAELTGLAAAEVAASPALLSCGGILGEETYPERQFLPGGRPTPAVGQLRAALGTSIAPADLVAYMTSGQPALGGRSPLEWLQAGGSVDSIIRSAAA